MARGRYGGILHGVFLMTLSISKILFTGDALRTQTSESAQLTNVEWLYRLLAQLLSNLTGAPCEIAFPLVTASVRDFVALHGPAIGLENWAARFWEPAPELLVERLANDCQDALVVLFEMPPVLQDGLDRAGIPWIDVGVSPLRFLPDWALHIRASAHFDLAAVQSFALTQHDIAAAARHVAQWYGPGSIDSPTPVFFAQTAQDRTLIKRGAFCGVDEVLGSIDHAPDELWVKPHPWQPDAPVTCALLDRGARLAPDETYALLANPCVAPVTLSSSIGCEAAAFGRDPTVIHPQVQSWAYSGLDILHHALSPSFWGALLATSGMQICSQNGTIMDESWRPNRLRRTIGGQGLHLDVWEPPAAPAIS